MVARRQHISDELSRRPTNATPQKYSETSLWRQERPPLHSMSRPHRQHRPSTLPSSESKPFLPRYNGTSGQLFRASDTIQLSSKTRSQLEGAIRQGWAHSTQLVYRQSVRQFDLFCNRERIPQRLRYPAGETLLCAFAASCAGILSAATARNRIAGLKAWHVADGLEWHGGRRLHYVLNGVNAMAPITSQRAPRPPVSRKMLLCLVTQLNPKDCRDRCIAAAALVAFWGQCRLGEIFGASATQAMTDRKASPRCADLHHPTRTHTASRILHLPRTKVQPVRGEDIVLPRRESLLDPLNALESHIAMNRLPAHVPLFAFRQGSFIAPLTRTAFLARCNQIWNAHGFPSLSGHSFRIGGTTELLVSGISTDVVKAMGRWSSDAFLRYWRSLEDIVPQHINSPARPLCRGHSHHSK